MHKQATVLDKMFATFNIGQTFKYCVADMEDYVYLCGRGGHQSPYTSNVLFTHAAWSIHAPIYHTSIAVGAGCMASAYTWTHAADGSTTNDDKLLQITVLGRAGSISDAESCITLYHVWL